MSGLWYRVSHARHMPDICQTYITGCHKSGICLAYDICYEYNISGESRCQIPGRLPPPGPAEPGRWARQWFETSKSDSDSETALVGSTPWLELWLGRYPLVSVPISEDLKFYWQLYANRRPSGTLLTFDIEGRTVDIEGRTFDILISRCRRWNLRYRNSENDLRYRVRYNNTISKV